MPRGGVALIPVAVLRGSREEGRGHPYAHHPPIWKTRTSPYLGVILAAAGHSGSPDCPPTVKISNVRDGTEHPYSESSTSLNFRPMIQPLLKEQHCLHANRSCPWHNNLALSLYFVLLTHSQQS